jgi:hypothetical protein
MKILLPILPALIVSLSACNSNSGNETQTEKSEPAEPYTITYQGTEVREEGCTERNCTYVSIQYAVLKGGTNAEKINNTIEDELREIIKSRLPEPQAMGTWPELAQKFIEGYELFTMEFPDSEQKWYLKIESDKSILTEKYFTSYILTSDFMGGAHPNSYAMLAVFDLANGELIDVRELVDEEALTMETERMYRAQHKLKPNDPLDDSGYFFPGGIFSLPANMGITSEGVLIVYNPYEVAAYSKGMTSFTVPFSIISKESSAESESL